VNIILKNNTGIPPRLVSYETDPHESDKTDLFTYMAFLPLVCYIFALFTASSNPSCSAVSLFFTLRISLTTIQLYRKCHLLFCPS
jgi:hypothetical protein